MARIDREFERLLRGHNFDDLEAHAGAIYGVWGDFHLAYLNPGWYQFARENEGEPNISTNWGLGKPILNCMSGKIREFYEDKFNACLNAHAIWAYEYECSSDIFYRRYHQIVYPLGQREGLLFVNSLIIKRRHNAERRSARTVDRSLYMDRNGMISQCAFCRRVKNISGTEHWDWVPKWVKRCPKNTSHTYCPTCFGFYFPKSGN